ncbi:uncharacterized protein PITG_14741 [Phytophthora infestans T30-4]|uniref:Uncharacterized protein n=1 Tax=Phytophthora infestans (strain T30-4) TaxID=403677 RepID=D0NQZ7_PHYIT|nr:uncharacterized protein PITG_14741 [Phytophthora infestans T30-4]EEY63095.1 hypothetical protein PITG_14741 [Phytophthora infestans T30-4]|eukprot:XP_002898618.1 hypothetical protein PITG_14741 [Phytophthora infestans T30-4]
MLSTSRLVKLGALGGLDPTTSHSTYSSYSASISLPSEANKAWFALICSMFWLCRCSGRVANTATASVILVWSRVSVCSVCSSASRFDKTSRSRSISSASSGQVSPASSNTLPTSLILLPSTSRSTMLQIW